MTEKVNHPPHYNAHPAGIECIDVVEHMSFNVGNAIKYLWRADEKGAPIEDLRKAAWYIDREIQRRTGDVRDPHELARCPSLSPHRVGVDPAFLCALHAGHDGPHSEDSLPGSLSTRWT